MNILLNHIFSSVLQERIDGRTEQSTRTLRTENKDFKPENEAVFSHPTECIWVYLVYVLVLRRRRSRYIKETLLDYACQRKEMLILKA